MNFTKDNFDKIKGFLAAAYFEKENSGPNEISGSRAMNKIRSLGPLSAKKSYFEFFEPFIWRLAPVASILILLLSFAMANIDLFPDTELTMTFSEDPLDFSLLSMFDV